MSTASQSATIDDLYHVSEKAEIVDGRIVPMPATGAKPGYAGDEIFVSLRSYVRMNKRGRAVGDNKGFVVSLPERGSFSPDAAYYIGPDPGMGFYHGAPIFAAEVRSEGDYGTRAESAMAAKRADYFAAGTQVVWDVDLTGGDIIRVYRADDPTHPTIYHQGDIAEAEPAVPGWKFPVDELYA